MVEIDKLSSLHAASSFVVCIALLCLKLYNILWGSGDWQADIITFVSYAITFTILLVLSVSELVVASGVNHMVRYQTFS